MNEQHSAGSSKASDDVEAVAARIFEQARVCDDASYVMVPRFLIGKLREAIKAHGIELCPHGMPLADNTCGPCSKGKPNAHETSEHKHVWCRNVGEQHYHCTGEGCNAIKPYGKPCTCYGSTHGCSVDAGHRLGELWFCQKRWDALLKERGELKAAAPLTSYGEELLARAKLCQCGICEACEFAEKHAENGRAE